AEIALRPDPDAARRPRERAGKGLLMCAQLLPDRPGQPAVGTGVEPHPAVAADDPDLGQLLRIADGQAPEPHGIEYLEDGGVGADTEGEGQRGHDGEPGTAPQRAERVANVAREDLDRGGWGHGVPPDAIGDAPGRRKVAILTYDFVDALRSSASRGPDEPAPAVLVQGPTWYVQELIGLYVSFASSRTS